MMSGRRVVHVGEGAEGDEAVATSFEAEVGQGLLLPSRLNVLEKRVHRDGPDEVDPVIG